MKKNFELEIIDLDDFDKYYDENHFNTKELALPYQKEKDDLWYSKTKDKSIAEQLEFEKLVKII